MQFQILVHCAGEDGGAERIRQILGSARITADLLHQPGPGKLLIRRSFTEAQAVKLREQLLGLGLRSSIVPLKKPQSEPGRPSRKPDTNAAPALQRLNQQIQSLFREPGQDASALQAGAFSSWLTFSRTLTRPLLDILLLLLVCTLPPVAIGWVASKAFGLSFLVGLLTLPLFLLSLLHSVALLAFFLWPRQQMPVPRVKINSKADPRLILFTHRVADLVAASRPASIWLTISERPRMGSDERGSFLELPLPLLYRLNLTELASLLAGEAVRGSNRPLQLLERWRQALQRYMEHGLDLRQLEQAQMELESPAASRTLQRARNILLSGEKWRIARVRRHLERMDRLLANTASSRRARKMIWGSPAKHLEQTVAETQRSLSNFLQEARSADDFLLVDQVCAAVVAGAQLTANPVPDNALVQGAQPASILLKNLGDYDRQLSRLFYESQGFALKNFRLLSHDQIAKQRQRQEKLQQIASQYFAGWLHPRQFWQLPLLDLNKTRIVQQLNRCIAELRRLAPERRELISNQERLRLQIAELKVARKLMANGSSYQFVHLPPVATDSLPSREALEAKLRECSEELFHQNGIMGERVMLGLILAQQKGVKTDKIIKALNSLAHMRPKVEQLQLELHEYQLLSSNRNSVSASVFNLHQRELLRALESSYQNLVRQLQRCPYDFCDPVIGDVGRLLVLRMQQHCPQDSSAKGKLLLAVVDEAHEKISQQAAGIAAQIERGYQIDQIKLLSRVAKDGSDEIMQTRVADG